MSFKQSIENYIVWQLRNKHAQNINSKEYICINHPTHDVDVDLIKREVYVYDGSNLISVMPLNFKNLYNLIKSKY